MPVSGHTRICGIIGDPIGHTVSPAMQNAAFSAAGLDYLYVPFNVKSAALCQALEGMRALNIRGLNVTVPHKIAVVPFLNKLDPLAEKIGAVNTIVNDGGTLTGYNTDASGFMQSLSVNGIDPAGKNIIILGAGGASRAIAFALAEQGAVLTILNRASGMKRAEELAGRLKGKALELDEINLKNTIEQADILVNATSVGMSPDIEATPVPAKLHKSGLVVVDIIYNPQITRLLKDAWQAGAKRIEGAEMLVRQGAQSFELWTGASAPIGIMKGAAYKALSQYSSFPRREPDMN